MSFVQKMGISKVTAFFFSLPVMATYFYVYYIYIEDKPAEVYLSAICFFGILLHFFQKIDAGEEEEVLFFGMSTGRFWSGGFCLVPTFLHILHNIGIHLLWDLKKPKYNPSGNDVRISHHRDQNKPEYKVTVNTSLIKMSFYNFLTKICSWYFIDWKDGDQKLLYQRFGFRILIFAVFAAFLSNGWNFIFPKVVWAKPIQYLADKTPVYDPKLGQCVKISQGQSAGIFVNHKVKNITYWDKTDVLIGTSKGNHAVSTWGDVVEMTSKVEKDPFPGTLIVMANPSLIPLFRSKVCF